MNTGGLAYTSTYGFIYSPDTYYYYPGVMSTYLDSSQSISNTFNEEIYQSERWAVGIWGYNLPIATDGTYVLILQFAEIVYSATNTRIFTAKIGDYVILNNIDLVALVGKFAAKDIFVEFSLVSGNIFVSGNLITNAYIGGNLVVGFYPISDAGKISGVILLKGNCAMNDNCNMCYKPLCATCNEVTLVCSYCITNAQFVGGECQCNVGTYWDPSTGNCEKCDNLCSDCYGSVNFICTTCVTSNILVSNVCLRECPYGFGSCAPVSTAVIDINFANYFYGAYGLFMTGTDSSRYYFFNAPEAVDPLPAKMRGLYFYGGSYLQTSSSIYISLNFSIGIWVWILPGSGDILGNIPSNKITVSSTGVLTIILESRLEATTPISTIASNPSNSAWSYISFIISFSSSTISTTIVSYLNNSPQAPITINQYIYRDAKNNKIFLGQSSSSNFIGYIYQFTLWNVVVPNFNTQYSDQICGAGAVASCLWACSLTQWMNGGTATNCDSCPNGCVRSGSCNVCFDPLCLICTGFLTGLCTQCVANASGTPCACNTGYTLSADGFSCVPCFTGCHSCTGFLYYQCSTCLSSYYLYKTLCLTYCPSGYTANSSDHTCILPTSNTLSISLQNLIQLDTVNGVSVGSSNTNTYPSWETTDPIPSIYRGYYFSGSNYMSLSSFIISPYFTLVFWIKVLSNGYLFMKLDGATQYFNIYFVSGIPKINILLSDSTPLSISTFPSITTTWHYISITGGLTSGQTVLTRLINTMTVTSVTSPSYAYFKDLGDLYIGKDNTASGGFTGFLWSFNIYNDNTYASQDYVSSGCPGCSICPSELLCPDECPFGQFYSSSSCVACTSSCPYGCRSTLTCRLCKDKECLACTTFDGTCTSCITNAHISGTTCVCNSNTFFDQSLDGCQACDNLCSTCQTNKYFMCTTCVATYLIVYNVCLKGCPYGYASPCVAIFTPVINALFDAGFQGTYNIFTTGVSPSSYQFFNTPETVDPIPAKKRGLYFNGSQYLISNVNIYLSYSFSMGFWIYVINSGDILTNSRIIVDSTGSIKIPLESPSEVSSTQTIAGSSFTMWKYLSFTCSFSSTTVATTLTVYINNVSGTSSSFSNLIYRDLTNQKIKIGGSSISYFTGFIYKYHLWNVANFIFAAQLYEICGVGLLATCLWSCDINKYLSTCQSCDSTCNLGCTRSGSCNICDDPLCSVCTGFGTNKCTTCVSNASGTPCSCNVGWYVSSDGFSCVPCFTGCASCTGLLYYQCTDCYSSYYLLNFLCDTQCPSGYSQNTVTHKCDLVNNLIVDLEFDDYIVLDTLSGFTVGNSNTNVYPIFDTHDPIPAINRGYYFTGQSYMTNSIVLSPYFSIMAWVKVIYQGVLFEKYNGATQYLIVNIDNSGYQNLNLLLKDGSLLTAVASQNVMTDWHYLSFSGEINVDGTYSSSIYADSILLLASTSTSKTYLRDSVSGTLLIGFDQLSATGFQGYIWNLKIYNDETHANSAWTTTTCTFNPCTSCPIGDFCPSSCTFLSYPSTNSCDPCKSSYANGCRNNLACTLCREKECYSCTSFSNKCLSCITNAGFVGDSCQCNQNAYWNEKTETCDLCDTICSSCTGPSFIECTQCGVSLFVLSNVCLEFCPSGYIASGNQCSLSNDLIFSLKLSQIKDTVYDSVGNVTFQTGNDNNFYPFYTLEDPFAAKLRGYYFTGTSFMKSIDTSPSLTLGAEFTIAAWINPAFHTGFIISKINSLSTKLIAFSLLSGKLNFTMKLKNVGAVSYSTPTLSVVLNSWNFIAVKSIITPTLQQTFSFYINSLNEISPNLASSWYQDISPAFSIRIGAGSDFISNLYKGFLWDIKIYNVDKPIESIISSGTCLECSFCPIELSNACIPNCDLLFYPNNLNCDSCQTQCTWGCVRHDKNCNLCQDVICLVCDDYTTTCITCKENAYLSSSICVCHDGYYWDLNDEKCTLCDHTCKTCTSSTSGDCIVCASGFYMHSGLCISNCPDGFILDGSEKLGNSTCLSVFNATLAVYPNNTLYLSFSDDLKQNLTNSQILIKIDNQTISSWSLVYISSKVYIIACDFGRNYLKNTVVKVYFEGSERIKSISGSVLLEKYLNGTLYDTNTLPEEILEIQNQVSAGVKVLVGIGTILSIFSLNPSSLWTMLNTIQLLSYIPYANYPITEKISIFFKSMNNFNIIPNIFLFFINENDSSPPYYQARDYGYDSYLILVNIGNDATALCGIIIAIPLVYYFSKCSQRFIGKKFHKIFKEYKFGTFLRFWIVSYLEFGFASIIGVLSPENFEIFGNSLEFSNYFICWAFIVIITITPFLHAYFSFKNLEKIINKKNRKWLAPWSSLFYEFKNDSGFMSTQYYSLFFARRLIFIATQTFLNDFPQSQLTINAVSAICIALFVLHYKPFEDKVIQVTNLITEFGISVIFLLLSPYFFDLGSIGIEIIDSTVIWFTTSLMVVQAIGPFINSVKEVYLTTKRSLTKDTKPHQIKKSKSPKKIELNKLDEFFNEASQTNIEETENHNYSNTNNE